MSVTPSDRVATERISLVNLIGESRSGRVFAGIDNILSRRVVVKHLAISAFRDLEERYRLIEEARILSRIDHPNLLRIHESGERDGYDCLTFEFADGIPLSRALRHGLDFATRVRIATAVASVLATTHRQGVIHGALSPDSVFIAHDGTVKVTDFLSISTRLEGPRAAPQWLSPEQIRGETATHATDMYAFGRLLEAMFAERDHDVRDLIASLLRDAPPDRSTAASVLERLQTLGKRRIRRLRTAGIALAAMVFLFGGTKYAVDLRRERAEAVRARAEADKRRMQANQLASFIIDDLHPKLESVGRLEVLDATSAEALAYFASLPAEAVSPREAAMNAKAVSQVGLVQASKGDFARAISTLKQAVAMAEAAARRAPDDDELRFTAGTAHADLGVAYDKAGRYDEAMVHRRIYAKTIDALSRRYPGERRFLRERAYVANHIGTGFERREDSAPALKELALAATIMRQLMATDTRDEMVLEVGICFYKAGLAMFKAGQLANAERQLEEGRTLLEPRIGRRSSPVAMRQLLAVHHDHLAAIALARGDVPAAARHAARERAIMEELIRFEPGNADWSRQMAIALRTSGSVSRMSGDIAGAIRSHTEALRILDGARARDTLLLRSEMATTRTELARSLLAAGRFGAAAANTAEAIEILRPGRNDIAAHRALADALFIHGEAQAAARDRAAATASWLNALDLLRPLDAVSQDPRIAGTHASVLVRLGRAEEAQPLIDDLAAIGYRNQEFEVLCGRRDNSPGITIERR